MARKKNTMRPDGRFKVTYTPPYGKTVYFYSYQSTAAAEKENNKYLINLKESMKEKDLLVFTPFKVIAEEYYQNVAVVVFSFKTHRDKYAMLKKLIHHIGGNTPLCEIKQKHIQTFINSYKGMSKTTIKRARAVCNGVFRYAENNYNNPSPYRGIEMPQTAVPKDKRCYSDAQRKIVLDYAIESGEKGLFTFIALHTGMRFGEIVACNPK